MVVEFDALCPDDLSWSRVSGQATPMKGPITVSHVALKCSLTSWSCSATCWPIVLDDALQITGHCSLTLQQAGQPALDASCIDTHTNILMLEW
jgi:hypothetical protein